MHVRCAIMRTALDCCCLHVPALRPIPHPCPSNRRALRPETRVPIVDGSCSRSRLPHAGCLHRSCGNGEVQRPRRLPSWRFCFELAQEVPVDLALPICEYQLMLLGIALVHSLFDLRYQLCRNRNESVFSGLLFLLTLEAEMPPRFRLEVQCAFSPVEVGVFRVLHLGIPNTGSQEHNRRAVSVLLPLPQTAS